MSTGLAHGVNERIARILKTTRGAPIGRALGGGAVELIALALVRHAVRSGGEKGGRKGRVRQCADSGPTHGNFDEQLSLIRALTAAKIVISTNPVAFVRTKCRPLRFRRRR